MLLTFLLWVMNFSANAQTFDAGEYQVRFSALYEATGVSLADLKALSLKEKQQYADLHILPVQDYLFGPLAYRALGRPKKSRDIIPEWNHVYQDGERIFIPYNYRGTWILNQGAKELAIPIPLNRETVFTPGWLDCTDPAPENRTEELYYYFWDPSRLGCDQKPNINFTEVRVHVGRRTPN